MRLIPPFAVAGTWSKAASSIPIVDPMNGEVFLQCPDTQPDELGPFVDAMRAVPKSGLHNPFKNPERCARRAGVCGSGRVP